MNQLLPPLTIDENEIIIKKMYKEFEEITNFLYTIKKQKRESLTHVLKDIEWLTNNGFIKKASDISIEMYAEDLYEKNIEIILTSLKFKLLNLNKFMIK